jgi:hypothetical protein
MAGPEEDDDEEERDGDQTEIRWIQGEGDADDGTD